MKGTRSLRRIVFYSRDKRNTYDFDVRRRRMKIQEDYEL